ncbi:MAG: RNA polymerase sigma factor [Dermatophilaceae bacterium]|nr:sigma-70 family RNA polymerase sigma factor [Intrasporangiaceae bacterium]
MWPRLVAALAHYCGDVHVAEELVQEALVRACQRWPHVSQLSSPEGWTYRVAVNLANSRLRRQRAERRAYARHGPTEPLASPVAVEDQRAVDAALRSLTDRQREVVILRFLLDLSVEQTAQLLGRRPGAVRALTHRAITRLRSLIDGADLASEEANDVT